MDGFLGFIGFPGVRAFSQDDPWQLFSLYLNERLKYTGLAGAIGLIVAISGVTGLIRV